MRDNIEGKGSLEKLKYIEENLTAWVNAEDALEGEGRQLARECILSAYNHNLKSLQLAGLSLSSLPDAIGELDKLEVLFLFNNNLSRLPASMKHMKSLSRLWLNRNKFVEFPEVITEINSLVLLVFSGNNLSKVPDSVSNLDLLQSLSLYGNKLSELPESLFKLYNLINLNIAHNRFVKIPSVIGRMSELKTLNLSGVKLRNFSEILRGLQALRSLYLSECNISTLPRGVSELKDLENLDLSGNYFRHFPIEVLGLQKLQTLCLDNNHIKFLPKELVKMKCLKGLYVSGNQLEEFPIDYRSETNIDEVIINNNLVYHWHGGELIQDVEHDLQEMVNNALRCDSLHFISKLLVSGAGYQAERANIDMVLLAYKELGDKIPEKAARIFALRERIISMVEEHVEDAAGSKAEIANAAILWVLRNIGAIKDVNNMRITSHEGMQDRSPAFYPLPGGLNFAEKMLVEDFRIVAKPRVRVLVWEAIMDDLLDPVRKVKHNGVSAKVTEEAPRVEELEAPSPPKFVANFRNQVKGVERQSTKSHIDLLLESVPESKDDNGDVKEVERSVERAAQPRSRFVANIRNKTRYMNHTEASEAKKNQFTHSDEYVRLLTEFKESNKVFSSLRQNMAGINIGR